MKAFALIILLLAFRHAEAGQDWSIDWHSIDSGGTMSATAGDWELKGTIGQPDATEARALTGSDWALTGGFWAFLGNGVELADRLFGDRFQSSSD
ncbi:MAG: hypothetical protein JJU31_16200 [Wenzhouxiangella sp.]|nr:hypothetical protein [Wenzhouxiangella sp.]MCH8478396.1 hypothetical protein [Wenzhouxiangella sp.]